MKGSIARGAGPDLLGSHVLWQRHGAAVRNSPWRDKGAGVLPDLGRICWIPRCSGLAIPPFNSIVSGDRFENSAFDHAHVYRANADPC